MSQPCYAFFSVPPSGLVILFCLPGASPLAMCFLPFGPVVERRDSSLSYEKTRLKNEVPLRSTSKSYRRPNLMFRNFKVRRIAIRQPPESPFSKGDVKNSPLIKGARGLFLTGICRVSKSRCQRQPNLMYWKFKTIS